MVRSRHGFFMVAVSPICVFFMLSASRATAYPDEFAEESLLLNVLNNEHLYATFNFSTVSSNTKAFRGHHYDLIPRRIGELLQKYKVSEFHLTMTQGLWRYEMWGYPHFPAPPGAQLWVWFSPDVESVDDAWYGFTNALSGLLCASLNFIGRTETVSPKLSFSPEGAISDDSRKYLRYAILSKENLCTENLTPWLKLLPCGSNSGVGWFLNPAKLHHSQYLSLRLHFRQSCPNGACLDPVLQLQQSVSTVYNLRTSTKRRPEFSLERLLEKRIRGACPLARRSVIKLSVPKGTYAQPEPKYIEDGVAIYDLFEAPRHSDVQLLWREIPVFRRPKPPPLTAHCHITGYGQEDGGVRCRVTNSADHNVTIVVMQTVPWFLQVYLHTFEIKDQDGMALQAKSMTFRPAKIRQTPHFLEYVVTIPPTSTIETAMQFSRGFLTWTEHPPDPNHGFYIGSAVISVKNDEIGLKGGADDVHRIYTEALQVHIPLPDFSMPYNVICLACTVLAIAFGSLHNLTTRTLQKVDPDDAGQNVLTKALGKVKALFRRSSDAPSSGR